MMHSLAERDVLCPHLYTGKLLVIIRAPYTAGPSDSSSLMQQAVVSSLTSPRYLNSGQSVLLLSVTS